MYFDAKHGRASESVYVGGRLASNSFFFLFLQNGNGSKDSKGIVSTGSKGQCSQASSS